MAYIKFKCGKRESKGIFNYRDICNVYPRDPLTNLPFSDTAQLLNDNLPPELRLKIETALLSNSQQGDYAPAEVTDKDLFIACPSRYYMGDILDKQAFSDAVSKHLEDSDRATAVEQLLQQPLTPIDSNSNDSNNNSND